MTAPLLTTQEVAALLKVKDAKTVRLLIKSGKLKRVIVGARSVRFREEDVQEYMRGLPCHSSAEAVSGTTNLRSTANVIAGPHGRRTKRKLASSNSENVTTLPWVRKKEPSL